MEHRDSTGSKYGMWFFLITELIFFGGLFLLYSVFRESHPQDFHTAAQDESILLGTLNTAVLLTSSLTIALSIAALRKGSSRLSYFLQGATVLQGMVFLVVKYFEWSDKILRGIYPDSPVMMQKSHGEIIFFSLYYAMTGLHGLHVLVGIFVISFMMYYTAKGSIGAQNVTLLENTGLYWHFVDIVWIYLFPLFYLAT
ncbi:MAG: cytochrome c oxidase subunit 3 family protein [Alphaproteobacteria bacterium]|uniref:Cytochrome c oxidase subunit 3 family protein n=1 Tax=Candidatus Nitrobium versatile TaxID=2884831 RepID=A0A953JAG2_9BACT|nr:cytochrome c oxidase subunit 3 family protein [Candidatus Nitrobium versatile]